MPILRGVIQDEYERNLRMQDAYRKELEGLPSRAVVHKRIKGRLYYYRVERIGRKVVNHYLSPKENDIDALLKQDARRRHLKRLLSDLKEEQQDMRRFLKA